MRNKCSISLGKPGEKCPRIKFSFTREDNIKNDIKEREIKDRTQNTSFYDQENKSSVSV
jgi:hypothetical protein